MIENGTMTYHVVSGNRMYIDESVCLLGLESLRLTRLRIDGYASFKHRAVELTARLREPRRMRLHPGWNVY